MLKKIISGGQTGADVAGLDVTIKHGIPNHLKRERSTAVFEDC